MKGGARIKYKDGKPDLRALAEELRAVAPWAVGSVQWAADEIDTTGEKAKALIRKLRKQEEYAMEQERLGDAVGIEVDPDA